jgi:DNA-binding protein H-NS
VAKASKEIKRSVTELLKLREEHIAEAERVQKKIQKVAKEEAQEIWEDIKKHFHRLEETFISLEMTDELKEFVNHKLDDLSAIKEIIEEKKAEQKARKTSKSGTRSRKTLMYWNPRNHKQAWSGKGERPDWAVNDMDSMPNYIHRQNPKYNELVTQPKRQH